MTSIKNSLITFIVTLGRAHSDKPRQTLHCVKALSISTLSFFRGFNKSKQVCCHFLYLSECYSLLVITYVVVQLESLKEKLPLAMIIK